MRRFEFAIAGTLACLLFFADLAPGSQEPAWSYIAVERAMAARLETDAASTTHNAESASTTRDSEAVTSPDDFGLGGSQELSSDAPANEARKRTSLERARMALAESTATALSGQELCTTLVQVAHSNDLPLGFFTNLIWRESRFDHDAISPVGAMGIAQFMPDVADKLSVDAFDSRSALPASARLLRTLRSRFGNLGLAAAAYNAGPKRVSDWLEGRSSLPRETQDYVYLITGQPAAHWQRSRTAVYRVPRQVPCHATEAFASAEQIERIQQERTVAEETRIAEQKAREAAVRRLAELKQRAQKTKTVARAARLQIASRVEKTKSATNARPGKIRIAQLRR
jgi:soluble lytic murein transglycosylase-like protein